MRFTFVLALMAGGLTAAETNAPDFQKDVQPIFTKYCIGCHAASVNMGKFALDSYQNLLKGATHGPVVVAGKSAKSRLYLSLTGKLSPAMPMNGQKLSEGELEVVRKWIDAGANAPAMPESAVASTSGGEPKLGLKAKPGLRPAIYSMTAHAGRIAYGKYGGGSIETREPSERVEWTGAEDAVRAVSFSPDGKLLAAAGGSPGVSGEVVLWAVGTKAPAQVRAIKGHTDCIYAVAFSPNGKTIATGSYDKFIKIWDVETGREVRTLKDHIDAVYALAFTPDGKRLISGSADRTIKIWNPETGERLYTLSEPTDGINTIALDPSGKYVVAGGLDKIVRVWELGERGGTLVSTLIAHEDAVLKVAWSPDGKQIASASADRTVKLFSAPGLMEIRTIPGQSEWITGLGFVENALAVSRLDGSSARIPLAAQNVAAR